MMDSNLKRAILMQHYERPLNKGLVADERYISRHMASDSCIDDFTIAVLVEDDEVKDVRFEGRGCTISTASISILSELLKGKKKAEAFKILDEYEKMINHQEYDEDLLEEANAFDSIYKQANRIKCGTIGHHALMQILQEDNDGRD